jgi:hypothetical protein
MKTEFDLMIPRSDGDIKSGFTLNIIGQEPNNKPHLSVDFGSAGRSKVYVLADKDLERFAVNILKALKSKHLTK